MKKFNLIKVFALAFILLSVFCIFSPTVCAKTSSYGSDANYDDTGSSNTRRCIQDFLLGALGKAIYAIGWCIEKLGALVVELLTKVKMFPWSDRVIFNSVPLLDVNFINPADNSLFWDKDTASYTLIGTSVRNVYFTGLSIGLGFFGIIVAVMAIRLAVATIAADKAKYKEAIVHWATALILLFALHYIISFVFYINEQLVEVACQIVNSQITSAGSNGKTVSDLGQFFKSEATNGWNTDTFISSIIYAVFVIQSLMFFYAYIKRLFYVLILAIISPFVVVYDFLKKAIS